jgi:hypothetical protein
MWISMYFFQNMNLIHIEIPQGLTHFVRYFIKYWGFAKCSSITAVAMAWRFVRRRFKKQRCFKKAAVARASPGASMQGITCKWQAYVCQRSVRYNGQSCSAEFAGKLKNW